MLGSDLSACNTCAALNGRGDGGRERCKGALEEGGGAGGGKERRARRTGLGGGLGRSWEEGYGNDSCGI